MRHKLAALLLAAAIVLSLAGCKKGSSWDFDWDYDYVGPITGCLAPCN